MSDIQIQRQHQLGLHKAREVVLQWAEKAEAKFDMECTYEEGNEQDTLYFTRAGIKGTLEVCADRFDFQAQLGFLVSAFKSSIEAELIEQLDSLLVPTSAGKRKAATKTPTKTPTKARTKK
ncbi:MAG: polyhydroxyalkanoic acid system family protein [Giesbergeria sp.]